MAARVGSDKWLFFTTLLLIVVGLADILLPASAVVAQERYHSEFAYVGRQAGMGAGRRNGDAGADEHRYRFL